MSRSFKHTPMAAICGNNSAHYDKTLAARGVRRKHHQVLHIALSTGEYEVVLPHRLQCCHNNTYSWGRDGSQRWCGLDHHDWFRYIKATTKGFYGYGVEDFWYGDESYMTWPPQWYKEMMRK